MIVSIKTKKGVGGTTTYKDDSIKEIIIVEDKLQSTFTKTTDQKTKKEVWELVTKELN